MNHKRIVFYALGGTIAMSGQGGPVLPTLTGADLLSSVPGLDGEQLTVEVRDRERKPAGWLTFADIAALAQAIAQESDVDGVVVAQGTDTIEETAYLLDLWHHHDFPIVVTGAMRHPELAGPDGPANLLAAFRVAAAPASRGRGCLVVLNDEVHSARWVHKSHTVSPGAFTSPGAGQVGLLAEGAVVYHQPPAGRDPLALPTAGAEVGLAVASLSDDGGWLYRYTENLNGLVVAGFGVGHVPAVWVPVLEETARRIPVVLASRIGVGPVLGSTYGFVGSETDLTRQRGLIGAGLLDPFKARVLLWALLATGATRDQIAARFAA